MRKFVLATLAALAIGTAAFAKPGGSTMLVEWILLALRQST